MEVGIIIRDIIVPVQPDSSRGAWPAENVALSLASRFEAHVTALAPSFMPAYPGMLAVEMPSELLEEIQKRSDKAAEAALAAFEERAQRADVPHESRAVRGQHSRGFADHFARAARTCDLAILPQPESEGAWERELVEATLFDSGRPALFIPYIHRGEFRPERVLIAWDGSRPAARSAHDALPLLRGVATVEVVTVRTEKHWADAVPASAFATHLARHGLKATAKELHGPDIGVAETMLSHAADAGTDLIVMGAYAHSRLRHLVFGGATSGILRSMTVPVLMAH